VKSRRRASRSVTHADRQDDTRNGLRFPRIIVTAAIGQLSSTATTLVWRNTDGRAVTCTMSGTRAIGSASLNGGLAIGSQWTLVATRREVGWFTRAEDTRNKRAS
jgi:hypothetical protein